MKKIVLILLAASLFMAAAFAASVSISSAALVGCECGTLSKANSVCTLTGDLAAKGTCFTVAASNVTINCNGFTITGPEGTTKAAQYGVYSDKDYTKVLNCRISRFSSAVYFHKASYGLIQNTSGNTTAKPADKQGNAIVLGSGASYNTITNVTASSKYGFGLFMDFGGNYNNVSNVNLAGPSDGLSMSIRADHTALNGIYSPGWAQIAGTYNTLADSKLATLNLDSMKSQQYNLYNVIYGNTFYVNAPGVAALNIYSGKNTLYWNNISNPSGSYVDDHSAGSDCQNYWNTTINGKPEGNLWGNVLNGSAVVTGNASSGYPSMALYIGNNGSSDPYSNTTSLGKISGPAVDYAPLTPLASRHVSGTVAYYNALNSSMQNVTVYLKQGGVTKYAATTGGSGFYNLPSVAQGTYDVYFSLPMAPGSINSGDAANAQGCSMNISQPWCYGITLLAMDVYQNSPSTIITSDDGSAIQQYYMYGGNWQNSPPPPGNFVFTPSQYATVNYSAFPIPFAAGSSTAGYSGVTMTVGATDVTQNFVSLCYGDADRSFMIPPASTRAVSGAITYGLSENQMHNVTVYLKQGGVTKYTATTPLAGAADYSFPAVIQGTYDVYFSLPMEPGSVSSTDASNVYWFLGYYGGAPQLSGIQILAIDTYQNSPSINITGDDGAAIQQYYMYGGNWQNSPPPPGNFVFTTSQYGTAMYASSSIPAMPYAAGSATAGYSGITLTVGASDVPQDFVAACYGDENLSYLTN